MLFIYIPLAHCIDAPILKSGTANGFRNIALEMMPEDGSISLVLLWRDKER